MCYSPLDGCTSVLLFNLAKKMPQESHSSTVQVDFAEGFTRGSAGRAPNHSWRRGYLANGSCARSLSREVKHSTVGDYQGCCCVLWLATIGPSPVHAQRALDTRRGRRGNCSTR